LPADTVVAAWLGLDWKALSTALSPVNGRVIDGILLV
jgi:hypothetical protein